MTEARFQAKLLKELRKHPALKEAVIFKHSDRFNGGVPDISITIGAQTTWLELKVYPNKPDKLQQFYLNRMQRSHVLTLDSKTGYILNIWQCWDSIERAANDIAIRCLN